MKTHRYLLTLALSVFVASPVWAQDSGASPTADTPAVETPPQETPAAEVPDRPLEERLTFLLSGYEYFPTRTDLDAVASAELVSTTLRSFVEDADRRPTQRLRAVDALGYYDDEATVTLLTRLATTSPKDGLSRREIRTANLLQHHAITALAKSKGEASVELLAPLFDSEDVQIVLTAVHAIAKHGGKSGLQALATLKENTDSALIRREVSKWVR